LVENGTAPRIGFTGVLLSLFDARSEAIRLVNVRQFASEVTPRVSDALTA
jgi:hypothetical protein